MQKTISFFLLILVVLVYFLQREREYDDVILLGSSLPKSGIMKEFGHSVHNGADAYFRYSNDHGLLQGKKIKFVTYDDKYEPDIMLENTHRLLTNEDLFLLFGFVGTPTIKRVLFTIKNSDIPFVAPITGADFLREKQHHSVVNFRASYHEEIASIIDYLYNQKNIRKFGVFYQNDDYGESGYISVINILNKYGLKRTASGSYKRNTLSLKQALNDIAKDKPEAIIMIGAYQPNALFIEKARNTDNLKNALFASISFGDADEMTKTLDYNATNIVFSQVVQSYNAQTQVVDEYKKIFKMYYPKKSYDFLSLEAFLSAKMTVQALQKTVGDITRSNFLQQIQKTIKQNSHFSKVYLYQFANGQFIEIK